MNEDKIYAKIHDSLKRWANIEKRLHGVELEIKVSDSINPGLFTVGVDIRELGNKTEEN